MVTASVLFAAFGTPAKAATTTVNIAGGSLDFSVVPTVNNFSDVTLNGSPQTVKTTFPSWGVNDSRGNNQGWNVTAQATQFSATGGKTLPTGSLTLNAPLAVLPQNPLNLLLAPNILAGPHTLDNGAAVKLASAPAGKGQGDWRFTQANLLGGDMGLTIPVDAQTGSYTSTVTFTLGSTP